ncbi:MFS transporter (plasmid) [Streptomyces sp. BHT-5-2]|uniref:MFS transporter n=1 Tax=unclassified Streptomyces TaxID=2593676 RepID=UPI001C8CF674|nr:MFS transporter [Streptomyces sp. BHT-5-2]QZL09000.1 MFS transporter [Streptomyces sp. BHT-5-2]
MNDTPTESRRRGPLSVLLIAQYLSAFGNAVTIVTVPLYVLGATGSSIATGLAGFANALPLIFAGAIGGVFIDRIGGRRMSVLSDLFAGVLIGLVPLLDQTTGLPLPLLMALLFGRTVVATPAQAARLSLIKPLAETAGVRLESANSWFQAAPRLGLVVGAPLAGLLVAVSGSVAGMYVDSATFLIASALVGFAVPRGRPAASSGEKLGFVRQLTEGMAVVRTIPVIGAMTAFVFVTNFLDDAFTPLMLPVYAKEILGNGEYLGWLLAASGVGAIAGTFLYPPLSRRFLTSRRYTLLGCFAVIAALRLLMVAHPGLFLMVALTFASGLAAGPLNPVLSTVMLERVPEELRGRVFGLSGAVAMAAAPLGILCAGWAVDGAGLTWALACFGTAYFVLILVSLRSRALRDMDAAPAAEAGEKEKESAHG